MNNTSSASALMVLDLYEQLKMKGYQPRSRADHEYLEKVGQLLTETTDPAQKEMLCNLLKNSLEMDYPNVYRSYYSGIKRKLATGKSWERVMYEAMKLFFEGRKIPTMIDYILQNP